MSFPKVSVIIPSYNHESFVGEAIESVLRQDFTDFELLIADDCSTDNSVNIIKSFDDERIKTFFFSENLGPTEILRFLIENSRGEYIALLNSDDRWRDGKLSKQVAFLEENKDFAACFTWASLIDEHGNASINGDVLDSEVFIQNNCNRYEWLNRFFYHGNRLCHPSVLIRKSVYEELGYYNGAYRQLPDFEYWIRLCSKHEIHILEEVFTEHRRTRGENQNTSALSQANALRNISEISNIFVRMFENLDDDTFIRAFGGNFINPKASSPAEIICEKFFLLFNNTTFGPVLRGQACQFYMNNYMKPGVAECFTSKYNFSQQDFYACNVPVLNNLKTSKLYTWYIKYLPEPIKRLYRFLRHLIKGK